MTTRGVLTASDDRRDLARTLPALVQSCRNKSIPITVIDHGLSGVQRRDLRRRGAHIVKCDADYGKNMGYIEKRHAGDKRASIRAWLKPLICSRVAPYDLNIWIDADAVLLRGEDEMFAKVEECGGFLTRDWWVVGEPEKMRGLYGKVIQRIYCPERDEPWLSDEEMSSLCHVNSGVFGWRKGAAWLDGWADMCSRIVNDPEALGKCRCRDQSGLAVWLAGRRENAPPFVEDVRWNYPANGLSAGRREHRKIPPQNVDLLVAARRMHPDAYVVHWLGRPKP